MTKLEISPRSPVLGYDGHVAKIDAKKLGSRIIE